MNFDDKTAPSIVCEAGEMVCHRGGANLITRGLGSSVAVAIYCPKSGCGGMLHYMLPHSSVDEKRALVNPRAFANTGLPHLLQGILEMGGDPRRAKVWMAGGASASKSSDFFGIGERNLTAARSWLWKEGLAWESLGCGGVISRDLCLELGTGVVGVYRFQNPGGEHAV